MQPVYRLYCGARVRTWHTFTVDGSAASRPFLEGKAEVRDARSPLLSKSVGPQSSSSAQLERNFSWSKTYTAVDLRANRRRSGRAPALRSTTKRVWRCPASLAFNDQLFA